MAEYGLIKDTTLTAIADGLRDKGIIPATRLDTVDVTYKKYKSGNATSLDDPTPTSRVNDTVTIEAAEGAVSMDIEFNIGYEYISGSAADMYVKSLDGSVTYWNFRPTSSTDKIQHVHVEAPSAKVEIALMAYQKSKCAWVATVQYYDSADNLISAGSEETEVINTIAPEDMAEAITNFDIPKAPPEEAFILTGTLQNKFSYNAWNWFIEQYGDKIVTKDITNLSYCFNESKSLTNIPFDLNIKEAAVFTYLFNSLYNLKELPNIRGTIKAGTTTDLSGMLTFCQSVRDLENIFEPEMLDFVETIKVTSAYSVVNPPTFSNCHSLRKVPSWWYKFRLNEESTAFPYSSYAIYYNTFNNCYTLDEVHDVPVWVCQSAQTSNMFSSMFYGGSRLKDITFETNNGQPIVAQWKSQTIELISYAGFVSSVSNILNYNSGITADKEVKDDATYQALKNDPDWWTANIAYCRYNHDSAVNTINSLPDTSAYLASAGGTNTIKFKGTAGSATDGGAIENLTAEEIAVATAKGWTVTLS